MPPDPACGTYEQERTQKPWRISTKTAVVSEPGKTTHLVKNSGIQYNFETSIYGTVPLDTHGRINGT